MSQRILVRIILVGRLGVARSSPDCLLGLWRGASVIRDMGGAPRNPAPRNNYLVWIVQPSGCHCKDGHLTSRVFTEDQQISQSADAT